MGETKHTGYYIVLIILVTIISINLIALILYFESPTSIIGRIKQQQPKYQGQRVPSVSNFSEIIEDPKFKKMKMYPPIKVIPEGNPNPFAPIIIKEK